MKEEKITLEDLNRKVNNLTAVVVFGLIIIFGLVLGLYFKGISNGTNTTDNKETVSDYDVSKMNELDLDGALALFKDKKTHVLYIGRSTCGYCKQLVPILTRVQEELNYETEYFPVENISTSLMEDIKELTDKFTKEVTVNGETASIGKQFSTHGYTPIVIIIKDGKAVDGFIGAKDYDGVKELVQKYIEK